MFFRYLRHGEVAFEAARSLDGLLARRVMRTPKSVDVLPNGQGDTDNRQCAGPGDQVIAPTPGETR